MKQVESIKESDGYLKRYTHHSTVLDCEMMFSVYLPSQVKTADVPALYWLSGLTCTDDNARVKAGAQRYAAEHGLALVFPDTSPRGNEVADEPERYDLGKGAGFYINATQEPWSAHYQMYDYVTQELPTLLETQLPLLIDKKSIFGHSMGGHGALICALKNPTAYQSVSAFAPICNPTQCDWGKDCFETYLGEEQLQWQAYDATTLIASGAKVADIFIDQGLADEFYEAKYLLPENLQVVCDKAGQKLTIRLQQGYDHSYHFVASFIGEHIAYHAKALKNASLG